MNCICVQCGKPCKEKHGKTKRDGSYIIKAVHDDGSPSHKYCEWPTLTAFFNRCLK